MSLASRANTTGLRSVTLSAVYSLFAPGNGIVITGRMVYESSTTLASAHPAQVVDEQK